MQAPYKEGKQSTRLKLRCGERTGKEWRRRLEVWSSLQAPAKAGTIEPSLTKEWKRANPPLEPPDTGHP